MRYLSPHDYGLVANHFSAALISRLGSVDWCCFPYLDSPSHFASYSDQNQGGSFQISPRGEFRSKQTYFARTLVLETLFETPSGRGTVSDWMPLAKDDPACPILCRKVSVIEGTIDWVLSCVPRFHYGTDTAQTEVHPRGVLFRGTHPEDRVILQADFELKMTERNSKAIGEFSLDTGQSTTVLWIWGRAGNFLEVNSHKKVQAPEVQPSVLQWRKLAHHCPPEGCVFGGPWHDLVSRSGVVLKSLTQAYSGGIAQSVTNTPKSHSRSHPNGDRHASLRYGAFVLQALDQLGYQDEARAYFAWTYNLLVRDGAEGLQSYYTLDGAKEGPERSPIYSLSSLDPRQFRLDTYGHLILTVSQYYRIFKELPPCIWPHLVGIADYLSQAWRRPDHGPWNYPGRTEHFVVSKLFCWKALEEICWLADRLNQPTSPRWIAEKGTLHRTICRQGFDSHQNTFVRSFGESALDSSCLWLVLLQFLPADDPRIQGTLHAIQTDLAQGVFIRRSKNRLEFNKEEPLDLLNSLQFTTALALSERHEEAIDRLAELCTYSNALGLMGNQITTPEHPLPEKFPCVETHTFLVNCALYVGSHRLKARVNYPLIGEEPLAA